MANFFDQFDTAPESGNFFDQFDAKPVAPKEESGFLRQVADVPLSVGRGAVTGVRMIADAFGAGTGASEALKGAEGYLSSLMSAQSKNDEKEVSRILKDAEDKGMMDQVKAGFKAFSVAPVDLLAQGFGTAAPAVLGILGAKVLGAGALGLKAAGVGIGAGMGAGSIKGGIYEETKAALREAGIDEAKAEQAAIQAQEYGGKNLDQILLGAGLGAVGGRFGVESAARRILTKAAGKETAKGATREVAEGAARTAVTESVPELLQGSQEQVAKNIALQREGFDVPTMRGVASSGTLEALAGAGLGAVTGGTEAGLRRQARGEAERILGEEAETKRIAEEEAKKPPVAPSTPLAPTPSSVQEPTPEPYVKPPSISGTKPDDQIGVREEPLAEPVSGGREAAGPSGVAPQRDDYAVLEQERQRLLQEPQTPENKKLLGRIKEQIDEVLRRDIERLRSEAETLKRNREADAEATKTSVFGQAELPPVESRNVVVGNMELGELQAREAPPVDPLTGKELKGFGRLEGQPQPMIPEVEAEVEKLTQDQALAIAERDKLEKRTSGTSLSQVLRGTLRDAELSELGGRARQVGKNPFLNLKAPKGQLGASMEDMVDSGKLDIFLPVKMRPDSPDYVNSESAEYVRDKLRNNQPYTYETELAIQQVENDIESIERQIQDLLSDDEINKELQYAADEQRELDQATQEPAAPEADRTPEQREAEKADSDFEKRKAQLDREEQLNEREARLLEERKRLEEERLKLESPTKDQVAEEEERKAKAPELDEREQIRKESEAGAGQFELTREEGRQDTTGDIFNQPEPEPTPEPKVVAISPEQERKEAMENFALKLRFPILPFRARSANKTQLLKPADLTSAQVKEIVGLASDALDLGMPPLVLGNVTAAGSTRMDVVAVMSSGGSLMIAKKWKDSSKAEKLQTLIHELAHAVDTAGGKPSEKASWAKAHAELQGWYTNSANKLQHPMAYPFAPQFRGRVRPKEESFAQAFAYYFVSPVDLQTNAPEAYSQIQSIIERIQDGSQEARATGTTKRSTFGIKIQPARSVEGAAVQPEAGTERATVGRAAQLADRGAGEVTAKNKSQIYKDADAIAAMDEDVRDNTEIGDFPGGPEAYNLYEARKLLKKPNDKLKRVTDSNSFSLWQDWDYIANVDGEYFGVSKEEEPDATDDEDAFVFSYARLDDPRNVKTTYTSDVGELFSVIRQDSLGGRSADINAMQVNPAHQNIFGEPVLGTWSITTDPKMELQDGLIYKLLDKNIDIKRVIEAVKSTGKEIATKWNPYLQEELYHGRTVEASKLFQDNEWLPLLQDMQKKDVTIGALEKYLLNRHAEDYNKLVAKRNPNRPEMQDGGSSVTTEAARKYLADLDADTKAKYEELAKRVDGITKGTRKLLVDTGYEKAETVEGWEKAFPNYVPLMREEMDFDYNFGSFGTGRGFDVRRDFSRSAMGSKRNVVDIIGNVIAARNNAIALTEKNRVAQAVYGLALEAPNPDFWMAINPDAEKIPEDAIDELRAMGLDEDAVKFLMKEPKQRVLDPKKNEVISRVNTKLRENDFVLSTRVNGEKRYVLFNPKDPRSARAATALKNLDAQDLGTTLGMIAKVTRWMASVNTQYNPIFGPYNFLRDIQAGALQLSTTELAGQQKEIAKLVIPSMGAIYSSLRKRRKGETVDSDMAKLWKEFQSEGGQTGFRDNFSRTQDRTEALLNEMEKITEGKAKAGARAVFDWLSDYNDSLENAVRLSAYKVAKEKFKKDGFSDSEAKQKAASLAKNLTVNFNRKGDVATQMGALYAFFNASMQGSARMVETLKGPMGKKIMAGGLLLGSMQALLLAAAGFDDEEPPEFIRSKNILIPTGNGNYVAFPMPLGFHVIPGISRILTEWAMSGFDDTARRVTDLTGLFLDAFNPVGNAGWSVQTITPTILDPLVALGENKDFTGKPISKEDMFSLNPTPGYSRAREGANFLTTALAEFLNAASGGDKDRQGVISPTPEQIEYLIGQATGGVGRELVKLTTTIDKTITGEDLPPYKIPLYGRFVGETKSAAAESNKFYKNMKELNELNNVVTGRRERKEPLGDFLKENPEARLLPLANKTFKDVQELRKRRKALLERDAPKESIQAVEKLITRRMQVLNERVKAMEDRN
jgi:hypothetical protein